MTTTTMEPSILNDLLDPIRDCLTKEVAAKIVALRKQERAGQAR